MNIKNIMLTAKDQTPKTIYYMIPFIWNSRKNTKLVRKSQQ